MSLEWLEDVVPTTLVVRFGNFEKQYTVDSASIHEIDGKVTIFGELTPEPAA